MTRTTDQVIVTLFPKLVGEEIRDKIRAGDGYHKFFERLLNQQPI